MTTQSKQWYHEQRAAETYDRELRTRNEENVRRITEQHRREAEARAAPSPPESSSALAES